MEALSYEPGAIGNKELAMVQESIPRLLDAVRSRVDSEKNRGYWELWDATAQPPYSDFGTYHYLFPRPVNKDGRIPYIFMVEPSLWHRYFGVNLKEFYTDPATYLEYWLRIALYHFENFHDDYPLSLTIDIDFGSVFPQSLFGVETLYADNEAPWNGLEPVWKTEADFAKAKFPDFYESGLLPLAHRFYSEIKEMVGDDFRVHFISWRKGPFSLLVYLRGFEQLLMDLFDRPAFVHEMLDFISEAMIDWYDQRQAFTGDPWLGPLMLFNDEVSTPTLSPGLYKEFVFPYEKKLADYFGRVHYWHSCGDTTALAPVIARLPNVHMFDVGPWTDLAKAVDAYRYVPEATVMRRINPIDWVMRATEEQMRQPIEEVRSVCEGIIPTMVMYDGLNYQSDWKADWEKIHRLDQFCHEILHRPA
jgi:uroporphyrinogen-III decarboxylase